MQNIEKILRFQIEKNDKVVFLYAASIDDVKQDKVYF